MENRELLEEIASANSEIAQAADALQGLLHDLEVVPRAEKTTVSCVISEAFERLEGARARLAQLQELTAGSRTRR
jgi:hypothetical protein